MAAMEEAKEVAAKLAKDVAPAAIILFGSTARTGVGATGQGRPAPSRVPFQGAFYRGACFAAQEAAEEGFKAALLQKGRELERIHNIRRLPGISGEYGLDIVCDDGEIDFLVSICRGRDPAEEGLLSIKHPNADDARRAIAVAKNAILQLSIFLEMDS